MAVRDPTVNSDSHNKSHNTSIRKRNLHQRTKFRFGLGLCSLKFVCILLLVYFASPARSVANNNNNKKSNVDDASLSLYTGSVNILELRTEQHLKNKLWGKSKITVLEMYSMYCGHCQNYAPIYKDFARKVRHWSKYMQVHAIHCVTEPELCKTFEVEGFPTVKFFPPKSRLVSDGIDAPKGMSSVESMIESSRVLIEEHFGISVNKLVSLDDAYFGKGLSIPEIIHGLSYLLQIEITSLKWKFEDTDCKSLHDMIRVIVKILSPFDEYIASSFVDVLHILEYCPVKLSGKDLVNMWHYSKASVRKREETDYEFVFVDEGKQTYNNNHGNIPEIYLGKSIKQLSQVDVSQPQWSSCQGSEVRYKGFPCFLWSLFHTLLSNCPDDNDVYCGGKLLEKYYHFIAHYLSCQECRTHFLSNFEGMGPGKDSKERIFEYNKQQASLWLWEVHNHVNIRLSASASDDPMSPKAIFPTKKLCPSCIIGEESSSSDENVKIGDFVYDKDNVYSLLIQYYTLSSVTYKDTSQNEFMKRIILLFAMVSGVVLLLMLIFKRRSRTFKKLFKYALIALSCLVLVFFFGLEKEYM